VWTFGELVAAYGYGARRFQLLRTLHVDQSATLEGCTYYLGANMRSFISADWNGNHKVNFSNGMMDGQGMSIKYGFEFFGKPPEPDDGPRILTIHNPVET
jgi:hypothetical protein